MCGVGMVSVGKAWQTLFSSVFHLQHMHRCARDAYDPSTSEVVEGGARIEGLGH